MLHSIHRFKEVNGRLKVQDVFPADNNNLGIRVHTKILGFLLWLIGKAEFIKALDETGRSKIWSINKNSHKKWTRNLISNSHRFGLNNIDGLLKDVKSHLEQKKKKIEKTPKLPISQPQEEDLFELLIPNTTDNEMQKIEETVETKVDEPSKKDIPSDQSSEQASKPPSEPPSEQLSESPSEQPSEQLDQNPTIIFEEIIEGENEEDFTIEEAPNAKSDPVEQIENEIGIEEKEEIKSDVNESTDLLPWNEESLKENHLIELKKFAPLSAESIKIILASPKVAKIEIDSETFNEQTLVLLSELKEKCKESQRKLSFEINFFESIPLKFYSQFSPSNSVLAQQLMQLFTKDDRSYILWQFFKKITNDTQTKDLTKFFTQCMDRFIENDGFNFEALKLGEFESIPSFETISEDNLHIDEQIEIFTLCLTDKNENRKVHIQKFIEAFDTQLSINLFYIIQASLKEIEELKINDKEAYDIFCDSLSKVAFDPEFIKKLRSDEEKKVLTQYGFVVRSSKLPTEATEITEQI